MQRFIVRPTVLMVLLAGCASCKSSPESKRTSETVAAEAPGAKHARPSILFLFSDDHSAPDLGCYGNSALRTPNIDALAERGILFRQAYVTSPQCSPSRTSIVTGRSPHATGTSRLHAPLRGHETVIEALNEAGYFTGAYRKLHLGENIEAQFDFRGDDDEPFRTFFEKLPENQPFFLHVGFHDPHRPYQKGAFDPPHAPKDVVVPSFLPDTEAVRADLANYYDEIARMDAEVGEIRKLLEEYDLSEQTMVVFAGDNGMPFPGAKGTLYEPGVRVPLIITWPGEVEPGESNALVSLADLAPTWLAAAGIDDFPPTEGRPLLELLQGEPDSAVHPFIFTERNWHDDFEVIRSARDARYKLIYNVIPDRPYVPTEDLEGSPTWKSLLALRRQGALKPAHRQRYFEARPKLELYDLQSDPEEQINLASSEKHEGELERLKQALSQWMKQTNDFAPPPNPEYPPGYVPESSEP